MRNFFFIRVVRLWNAIPRGVLDLESSVSTNKTHLTEYLWKHFTQTIYAPFIFFVRVLNAKLFLSGPDQTFSNTRAPF